MTNGSATLKSAATRVRDLPRTFCDATGWDKCIEALTKNESATFDSVWGSSCAPLAAALGEALGRVVLAVFPTEKIADRFVDDLPTFSATPIKTFPTQELQTDDLSADPGYGQRLRLLKELVATRESPLPSIIATSIQALSQGAPPPRQVSESSFAIQLGEQLDFDRLRNWLVENAYQSTSAVQLPGEFSSRGGIMDIFAPDWTLPARVELFDDTVESIRFFDVGNQRSVEKCPAIEIAGLQTSQQAKAHLADFLPPGSVVLLVEPQEVESQSRMLTERLGIDGSQHALDAVQRSFQPHAVGFVGRLIADPGSACCRLPITLVEQFSGDISNVRQEVDRIATGRELFVITTTESESNRVAEILKPTETSQQGRLHFSVGCVHAGFRLDHLNIVVVSSDQMFRRDDLRRDLHRRQGKPIDSFVDLRDGDLVVHLAHGIGRFRGLKLLEKEGQRTEHLEIEFYGGTRIYVPATRIGLIQKYVGGTKTRPRLARIGSKTWLKQKQAAEEAVGDLAAEMLEIQAKRASRHGTAMQPDTAWQFEFEHSFPFHETVDQLRASISIKRDMQSEKPMERLLCGDVGYGKTEVAMRAAFKAVENGFQVAVLVPTTVLAEQHYRTFRQRMAEFPLDIAKLSRFCTAKQQRETIAGLKAGRIDIAIGTHRITSRDVAFKNLGLVVIDEEQRFGVAHKERLKSIRAEVDVLTLSATPIPRTLHMSLVGVRDISNLETAPEDRLAVQTRVTKWDANLIRESILREIQRDGQTFFVHNRINDIHIIKQKLQHIVPEATLEIAHGQMPEAQLEQAMTRFINGQCDILLATTIVESGLDIPNANTIFVNEADRYGLADLHQLRGRVGRYKNKAYCYLLIEPHKHVNPNAAKRLHAIEKYSEMGAGFAIAMRDLEIRGAGNLLGTEQSGHIASVGYELYCQLLEQAVRSLKKQPAKIRLDVDVDLPLEAYLPDQYVADRRQKIEIYRRLHQLESFEQIKQLRGELIDRYGTMPASVKRLIKLAELKLEATLWQVCGVFMEEKYLGFRFTNAARMRQLAAASKYNLRIVDDSTAYLTLRSPDIDPNRLVDLVKSILQAPVDLS